MKLQLRFLLLLIFIFSGVAGLVVIGHQENQSRTKNLLQTEAAQHQQHLESIVLVDGRSIQALASDYSYWDDMVNFVTSGNIEFAHNNIDTALANFSADSIWVYNADSKLVYRTHGELLDKDADLTWTKQLASKIDKTRTLHFYQNTPSGLFELQSATIVGTDDPGHKTSPKGYFVVGRLIDSVYTARISQLTQSTVQLNAAGSVGGNAATTDTISVAKLLPDYNGKPVAELRSGYKSTSVANLDSSYSEQLRLLLGLTLVMVIVSGLYIWREVLMPIKVISSAIKTKHIEKLDPITHMQTEFGELATTVKQFFSQKLTMSKTEFEKSTLEKMHKEKTAFLAVAAHELNNPVNAVRLFTEYLAVLYKKGAPPEKINLMIDRITAQINKANMLINDLHSASEGLGREITVNMQEVDFDKFLQEEINQVSLSIKHKIVLTGTTGQKVMTDPDRLGQVVFNLLRNAYRYSPDADMIHVAAKFENGQVVVGIQDFGMGISREDQTHIFEQFYRASNVADLFPGLGLGLAISKQIVERLGGKMWLESVKDLGSTFYFSIPSAGNAKKPPAAPAK